MRTQRVLLVLLGFLLVWPLGAQAAVVEMTARGTVTWVGGVVLPEPPVEIGDLYEYRFGYDTNMPDLTPTSNGGFYEAMWVSVRVGDIFVPPSDPGVGGIWVASSPPFFGTNSTQQLTELKLTGGFTLDGEGPEFVPFPKTLPTEPFPPGTFGRGFFHGNVYLPPDYYSQLFQFGGTITQLVPEPTSLLLFGFLLPTCLSRRRGKR